MLKDVAALVPSVGSVKSMIVLQSVFVQAMRSPGETVPISVISVVALAIAISGEMEKTKGQRDN